MGMQHIKQIPAAAEILQQLPLTAKGTEIKQQREEELRRALSGSGKFILIIGPCSADNEDSVCAYIEKLARVQERVSERVVIVPRIYTNKPRTTGEGYKGMAHQPDPGKAADLFEGVRAIRALHIRALSDYGLPAADEMLYPENYAYLADVLVYNTIGARSVENQQHRLTASGVDTPVGMKNPTSGDISVMLNAIRAAQMAHTYIYNGWEVQTTGNPYAHAILRGSVDFSGRTIPNYHYEDLSRLAAAYTELGLLNPAIIVDTNHANSDKRFYEQPRIAREVLLSRRYDPVLRGMVRGLMIESYLVEGRQEVGGGVFGQSITDPCLGWEDTEKLIDFIAENV